MSYRSSRSRVILAVAVLGLLVHAAGCDDATAPGSAGFDRPANLPDVVQRDPVRILSADQDAQVTFRLSAAAAHPGEAVEFEAGAVNLRDEPLEFYGLVCWPDSPRFFLVDGQGTEYRIEWRPVPPCPASLKHLPPGETATSRDWFSGFALLDDVPVDLPFGDYTARAEFTYRPVPAPGTGTSTVIAETPFRWEATAN